MNLIESLKHALSVPCFECGICRVDEDDLKAAIAALEGMTDIHKFIDRLRYADGITGIDLVEQLQEGKITLPKPPTN